MPHSANAFPLVVKESAVQLAGCTADSSLLLAAEWMAPAEPSHLPVDLLRPYPAEDMKAWKVSRAVGNVRNNDPSLIVPM